MASGLASAGCGSAFSWPRGGVTVRPLTGAIRILQTRKRRPLSQEAAESKPGHRRPRPERVLPLVPQGLSLRARGPPQPPVRYETESCATRFRTALGAFGDLVTSSHLLLHPQKPAVGFPTLRKCKTRNRAPHAQTQSHSSQLPPRRHSVYHRHQTAKYQVSVTCPRALPICFLPSYLCDYDFHLFYKELWVSLSLSLPDKHSAK